MSKKLGRIEVTLSEQHRAPEVKAQAGINVIACHKCQAAGVQSGAFASMSLDDLATLRTKIDAKDMRIAHCPRGHQCEVYFHS